MKIEIRICSRLFIKIVELFYYSIEKNTKNARNVLTFGD